MRTPNGRLNPWRSTKALSITAIASQILACASAMPVGFDQEAPDGRIHAILDAARNRDTARIPDLIAQLDSDDPAVRLFAIRTLELLTAQTLAYDYAGHPQARDQAIQRWADWLASQREGQAQADGGPTP